MHPSAHEYLSNLKNHCTQVVGKVVINPPSEAEQPAAKASQATLANYIQATFGEDIRKEVTQHQWDLDYWLAQLEQRLYDDLADYCSDDERQVLQNSALAYLPIINANAFAGHIPNEPTQHIIGVHLHLIWVAFYLTEALLLAAKGEDALACSHYQVGLNGHLQADFLAAFRIWLNNSAHSDDWLKTEAGAVSTVILRFVGLHELGHLVLGHVDKANMCYSPNTQSIEYKQSEHLGQSVVWDMEYAADQFAIDHMLAHTGSVEHMWNNLLFIGAFFRFIEHVELLRHAPASETHPPPVQRLHALEQRVTKAIGPPPNDAQRWAESLLLEWRDGE